MHRERNSNNAVPPAEGSGCSIEDIPDSILEHILGFLPAPESVRTCVLARRWRDLWKLATGMRVWWDDNYRMTPVVWEFMGRVLLGGESPLDTCELNLGEFQHEDMVPQVNHWLRHAMMRKVRVFSLDTFLDNAPYLELDDQPLASQHLTSTYPTFSKLKTLFLNEYWCMPGDFTTLACILERSPVLEKLTLELFCGGSKYEVEMEGRFSGERPTKISEHLNIVEVKCQDLDKRVLKVLKFLCTFNIRFSFESQVQENLGCHLIFSCSPFGNARL